MWNAIDEQDNSSLPQTNFGYFLVTLEHYSGGARFTDISYFIKDRGIAKEHHGAYSRKYQGKLSVHFMKSMTSYKVIAWAEIPKPYLGDVT